MRLILPDGKTIVNFLSREPKGPESAYWMALTAGTYRLEVMPVEKDARRGRYELFVEALRPATETDETRWRAEMASLAGSIAETNEKIAAAVQNYQEALRLFRQLHDRGREATVLIRSAENRQSLQQFAEAGQEMQSALAIYRELGDRKHEGDVLVRLGVNLRYLSQFDESVRVLEEGLALRRRLKDRVGEAEALDRLGMTWSVQDRYDKAISCYRQALTIDRKIRGEPLEVSRELNNLAVVYAFLNQNQKAIELFEEALGLARQMKDPARESVILNGLGAVNNNLKDYPKAVAWLEQALQIQAKLPDYYSGRQITLANLGSTYQRMGQSAKAIGYLEQALPVARAVKDGRTEGAVLNLLGRTYRFTGQYDQAIRYFEQARVTLRKVHSPEFEAMSLNGMMLCWKGKGQPRVAIFYGKQAVNQLQSVRSNISSLSRNLQESFLKGNNEETYHELAQLLISQQRLLEAEQVMDLMKVDEYRNFVRRESSGEPTPERKVDQTPAEAELAKRDAERVDRLMAIGAERGALMAKPSRSPEEGQRLDAMDRDLEEGNKKFQNFLAGLERDTSPARVDRHKLEELREGQGMMEDLRDLPAGTVAIYTLVTEEKYLAILITPDVEKAYEYPIRAVELNRLILDFRQALQNPALDARPLAQKLHAILLGKMADDLAQIKAQTLMWSLDGALRYLPVAALYDGRRYLIEQYRVSVITTASNARLKDHPSAKWEVLGLGVTKEQKGAPALPEVASELKGIVAQRPGAGGMQGEVMLDEQFTEAAMRASLRKRYPVVHIASHFHFQPGDEGNSFLLLGDGGHFTLSQLKSQTNLFSGVQLLTLSACSTGVSETDANGTEVEGFGVLAQREGARSVVASLWSVADVSTSLMMQKFYQIRQSAPEATKLEALRSAQLALLRGELQGDSAATKRALVHDQPKPLPGSVLADAPKFLTDPKAPYAHPYYWAAFYLMGNWL